MLLLLGRYEQVLAAISMLKDYVFSLGKSGDPAALHVIVPVAIGASISLVGITNILKWLLRHHEKPTIGLWLGVLMGSTVMLWTLVEKEGPRQYAEAAGLMVAGFAVTLGLSRLGGTHTRRATSQLKAPVGPSSGGA